MLSQRARGAESRAKHRSSNGPLRAWGNAEPDGFAEYSATSGCALSIRDMIVSRKVRSICESRWYHG